MRKLTVILAAIWALSLMGCSSFYWNRAQFEMKGNPFLAGREIIAESVAEKDSLKAEARVSTRGTGEEGFSINARGANEVYWRDGDKEVSYRNVPDYYGYGHYGGYYGRHPSYRRYSGYGRRCSYSRW